MSKLRAVRGAHDLFGDDERAMRAVAETARAQAAAYGFVEIRTPIFEHVGVFSRSLGETTDIVTKEMYSLEDRGGEQLVLRPENTASICRAFANHGMAQNAPARFFYAGPMFRYERPQKGRLRQFHQIGVELIGAPEPQADVDVIALAQRTLERLGVADAVTLELNTLGSSESRAAYRDTLTEYLEKRRDALSRDSLVRLARNPLRILDSKDEGDRAVIAEAPSMRDSLDDASRRFFDRVQEGLAELSIAYRLNDRLVRGLDYYTHSCFEFVTDALGAQGAVIAGGRYDGLVAALGGPDAPGVGWAGGIERLSMLVEVPAAPAPAAAIAPIGEAAERAARILADRLRREGLWIDLAYKGKLGQRMKRADRLGARYALILGEDELARGEVKRRDLASGEERSFSLDALSISDLI